MGLARSGFTLIEVLVALVVVTAALTIVAQGFLTGGRASVASQNETLATMLAESKMAEVEAGIISTQSSATGTFEPERPDFSWKTDVETTTVTGLTKLTLTVTWKEREEERTFVLTRLLVERTTQ
ncbi:MAG TPA: type II secretion system minor pseudopilin GspI [Planctomycetota bacterium]|nr:type II secretion system minor pseudopilin GspI [Planctomycetota bacterium]